MKILKRHTTSKGNELKFATFSHLSKETIIVIDSSCQMQRKYTIGRQGVLSFEYYDTGIATMIKNFKQVINAWINEEIHF